MRRSTKYDICWCEDHYEVFRNGSFLFRAETYLDVLMTIDETEEKK